LLLNGQPLALKVANLFAGELVALVCGLIFAIANLFVEFRDLAFEGGDVVAHCVSSF
jgi:hypothetical protein